MGGTKCLRLGTCELEYMGGVLQRNSSIINQDPSEDTAPPKSHRPNSAGSHAVSLHNNVLDEKSPVLAGAVNDPFTLYRSRRK